MRQNVSRCGTIVLVLVGVVGCGQPSDETLRRQAKQGDWYAMRALAERAGARGDQFEAADWLKLAALCGDSQSLDRLKEQASHGDAESTGSLVTYYGQRGERRLCMEYYYLYAKADPVRGNPDLVGVLNVFGGIEQLGENRAAKHLVRAKECLELAAKRDAMYYLLLTQLAADGLLSPVSEDERQTWTMAAAALPARDRQRLASYLNTIECPEVAQYALRITAEH